MKALRVFLAVPFFFMCFVVHAHAATLYMDPNTAELKRGNTIPISIRIDTDDDECINVVDSVITYSENIEPVDTSRGSSIFSVWVEEPVIDKKNRTITFAGGIPNGYCGRIPGDPRLTNTIMELVFRSPGLVIGSVPESDNAYIDFDPQTKVFLNDGFGTTAQTKLYGATIQLSDVVGTAQNAWVDRIGTDQTPPQEFSIILEHNTNAFSNRNYIIFNTTDKQSGIDHYEVIEEPLDKINFFGWGASNAPWITAKSPYVLKDQSLNSTIRVRAVDKAGNEYVATLVPDESQRSLSLRSKIMIALIATGLIVFVLAGFFSVFIFKRRSHPEEIHEEESIE